MRRIVGGIFVSLDGVIQAPDGPTEDPTGGFVHGGWMFPVSDDDVGAAIGEFFSQPYDLLLGRRTSTSSLLTGPMPTAMARRWAGRSPQ